jgi:deoxyribodipyrimidine photolyase-related protein
MRKRTQNHKPTPPLVFNNNVLEVLEEIDKTDIKTIEILMLLILFGP